MSLLSGFEQRLERTVEGFFSKLFRSGVHPVEIGKRLLRVMEDGKTVALRRTYVPNVYRILLSRDDHERLAPLEHKLVEEMEVFVSEAVRQRDWVLADSPRVSFVPDSRLARGEFKVEAQSVALEPAKARERAGDDIAHRPKPRPGSLVVMSPDGPAKTMPISGRIGIGRQSDNDLVIADPGVSRHHAEIVPIESDHVLRDLGSTNGTSVNGSKVTEHRLQEGDRVTLGHTVVEYRRT